MKRVYLILILVAVFLPFNNITSAQVRNTDIIVVMSPQYPAPNENVSATLKSYVLDLSKTYITWSVNGNPISSGIGKVSFSFDAGNIGITTNVTATIDTVNSTSLSKTFSITPTDVDMLWEAVDSYTTPFYRGKTMVGKEGTFKVVAVPSVISGVQMVHPSNLSYEWTKEDKGQLESSGWGKNIFSFKTSFLDDSVDVKVKVSDVSGNKIGEGKIDLKPVLPKLVFYKKDPETGVMLHNALNSSSKIDKNGAIIVAVPYFFSFTDIKSKDFEFKWSINGRPLNETSPKNELSIKGQEGKTGQASIEAEVNNTTTMFQTATKKINVNF